MNERRAIPNLPIILRIPVEMLAIPLMLTAFFGLIFLCMGAAAGSFGMCAAGAAVLAAGTLWFHFERKKEIIFEAGRVTVRTAFSRETYPYDGLNFLLRRSWTVTGRRWLPSGAGMLADTAIQLRQGKRAVVSVPVSWRGANGFQEAVAFLESLPNPKKYL